MKSYNHLYEQYLADENYTLAIFNATKHKSGLKKKNQTARYYRNNYEALRSSILEYAENFYVPQHKSLLIYDGIRRKQRKIIVPTMKEQIIHHMVINILKPIFLRPMYEHSYGSIPNRGPHLAKKTIEKWIQKDSINTKYCLKMDISKYFESISRKILKQKLADLIHDQKFLKILYLIIDIDKNETGIPIGFYTSQWFANWYLTDLDHFIKEKLGAIYYVRYMDDMVIFSSDKKQLHQFKKDIEIFLLTQLGLKLKDNWQVFKFDCIKDNMHFGRDLDFMGFRFYHDRTTLRKTLIIKITRKARRASNKKRTTVHDARQMLSYLGWLICTNTYQMYLCRIKPYINFNILREKISKHEKSFRRSILCGIKLQVT